jgi:serine/threonine-protein kinase
MRLGLDGPDLSLSGQGPAVTVDFRPGALETIAESVGPVPHVLLRDTGPDEEAGPVLRPAPEADPAIRYRIDGEIGRGGMGRVLKGRDPDLNRDVALKVLRDDLRDRPEAVRRFVEEAQIGGQLQHPGIVPVYELGTMGDRRPFFSMKLIKGQTLAALLAGRPDPGAGLPRFLVVFEAVCQTVAYAHARGVIHRDLKPSNVMVGSFGEVQVMDWGLAKVLPRGGRADDAQAGRSEADETVIATARSGGAEAELSHAGSVLGTPAYMAPEQARGEIAGVDERADVFALGSILCEILTGAPAFLGRSAGEIQRKAALGDTAGALGRLDASGAEAELVALAKACLAAEPIDRPRDARAVSNAVTAHLAGVQARLKAAELARAAESVRAEEATQRALVERDRRRMTVALAATVVVLIGVAGGSGVWYAQQRQALRVRIDRLIDRAEGALERVERDDLAAASAPWEEARLALAEAEEAAGRRPPAAIAARLRDGRARLTRAGRLRTLLAELETIRGTRSEYASEYADDSRADREYAEAFRAYGLNVAAEATDPAEAGAALAGRSSSPEIAAALDDWTWVRFRRADRKDVPAWRRLVATARAADPDPWRDALRAQLGQPTARATAVLKEIARDLKGLEGQPVHGLTLLARLLREAGERDLSATILHLAWRLAPGDFWVNYELAGSSWHEATWRIERPEEAVRFGTAAVAARPRSAIAHDSLGGALQARGDLQAAIAEHRAAVRLKPGMTSAHVNLGVALRRKGNVDAAIAELREALRLDPDLPLAHNNLGNALHEKGDLDGAIAEHRETLRLKPDSAGAHTNLGNVLRQKGDLDGALAEQREAVRLSPELAEAHYNLGKVLHVRGDLDEALAEQRTAIRLRPEQADFHLGLGAILFDRGDRKAAIAEWREAIRLKPDLVDAHDNLAGALAREDDLDGAIAAWREVARLQPGRALAQFNLGVSLFRKGDLNGAIAHYRAAIQADPKLASAHRGIGNVLEGKGDLDGAIDAYREALRWEPDNAGAHLDLGNALRAKRDVDGAVAQYRAAIRLKPALAAAHHNLGSVLRDAGDLEGALAAHRTAVRLEPGNAVAHYHLGLDLQDKGDTDSAIAAYREAIRLDADSAEAHCNLGILLRDRGEFEPALAALRRGDALGSSQPGWRYPSAEWVRQTERLVALVARLPAVLQGKDRPGAKGERLAFAQVAQQTGHYAAAARLFAEALEAEPKLGDERGAQHRYNAACAAALAAAGAGKDDPPPDDAGRAQLRSQALGWLQAELAVWEKILQAGNSNTRTAIAATLRHWQTDRDLASVRQASALDRLPEAEHAEWCALWDEAARLQKRAMTPP